MCRGRCCFQKSCRRAPDFCKGVDENFKDFDRHRDGTITVPQFQTAIAMTWSKHAPLSQVRRDCGFTYGHLGEVCKWRRALGLQEEMETLIRSYACEKSGQTHIRWKAFTGDVNSVFAAEGLEKAPLGVVPTLGAPVPRPKVSLSPAEETIVGDVLQRMRWHCHTRRVLVKPFFADAEYNRRSMRVVDHITKAQFCQVLSRLGLDATNAELELLGRKFDDQQDGFVNYVSFACAVDPEEQSSNRDENAASTRKLAAFKTNGNFKASKIAAVQPGRPPITSDFPSLRPSKRCSTLEGLMRRLQEKVIQFKIPVADFLFDYDRHKLGAISRPQFRRGLNFAFGNAYVRESIASEEMSLLEDAYAREMLDGALFVDWKQFCNDINAAITLTHLETKPTATPHPHKIERQAVVLSPAEEARVQQLLAAMRKRFQIRSVYVKAPFHDFAQSTNSPMMVDHVTRQQFVQGLSRLGIEPAAADLELLFKKFDDGDEGSVNYVAFTTAVDDTETFSDRSRPVVGSNLYGGFRKPKVHEELLKSL